MKRSAKCRDRSQLYMCTGENFRRDVPIGDCGKTKPLIEWLEQFSGKSKEELTKKFNEHYKNKDIVDHIALNWEKTLEVVR